MMTDGPKHKRFTFISSNEVWGGSEELWSLTALELANRGHAVSVVKPRLDPAEPRLAALRAIGCRMIDMFGPHCLPRKLRTALLLYWPVARHLIERCLQAGLTPRPDLAIISQGLNFDGFVAADACWRLGIPYVLISQKAADMYWPADRNRDKCRAMHRNARATLFVSEDNRRLTEEQLACPLDNAIVVRNPFNTAWQRRTDWPDGPYRFACLARLDVREKGQDLLLRVLALPKWRARPIGVRFHGAGHNAEGLADLARFLGLDNVEFGGFTTRPEQVWDDCHGLILPSHCEGLPLSLVEAMLNARVAIVTAVGGASEAVIDGQTGFLASAATVEHLDAAMDRAWARRDDWRAIGDAAAEHIRRIVPSDPPATLANLLIDLSAHADARTSQPRPSMELDAGSAGRYRPDATRPLDDAITAL